MTTKSSSDNDVDVAETLTSQVIGFFFRNAIVARIRAERRLLRVLLEALVLASMVAIFGRTYMGLPLSLCFSAVIALVAEAFLQVHFAVAYKLYGAWTTFRRQAYLTVGAFFLSRLVLGDILGVPSPADSLRDIQTRGGLELLLDIPLVIVSMAAVVKKSRKALIFFNVLAIVFMFLTAMPIPRAAYHACIPANGVIVCTWKLLFTGFGR